jgi:hypothetical protein
MKILIFPVLILFSFSTNAQVELYNRGETGPSLGLSVTPFFLISGGMVIKGRWGFNINTNIPTRSNSSFSTSPRIFAVGGSYALKKSKSVTETFSLPASVTYTSFSNRSALSLGLTFANKIKLNQIVYLTTSATIIGNRFYSNYDNPKSGFGLSAGFSLQVIRFVTSLSYNFTNASLFESSSNAFWGLSVGLAIGNNKPVSNEK